MYRERDVYMYIYIYSSKSRDPDIMTSNLLTAKLAACCYCTLHIRIRVLNRIVLKRLAFSDGHRYHVGTKCSALGVISSHCL